MNMTLRKKKWLDKESEKQFKLNSILMGFNYPHTHTQKWQTITTYSRVCKKSQFYLVRYLLYVKLVSINWKERQ